MDYEEAEKYILSLTDYEKIPSQAYSAANFDLRRMEELLERLGHPQLAARTVHIAGTKGKGSTAAMIASALTASGYRTGLFTSPHLHTMRERIRLDGQLISGGELVGLVEELKPHAEAMMAQPRYGDLTTFELLTALAFSYFKEKRADFQVLEVGLGGRLDATNVVDSRVAVITSISFDHTDILGHTLAEIAREKAGIIKPGVVVVSSPQAPEASQVIEEVCRQRGASLIQVGRDISWQQTSRNLSGQSFMAYGRKGTYSLFIPLLGDYQLENAATAVAALETLMAENPRLTPEAIARGLAGVSWPGRLQVLRQKPWVVVDGAHNAYSARRLKEAIVEYFHPERVFLVMGTQVDKDIDGMVAELASLASHILVTASRHPRAAPPARLVEEFARRGREAEIQPSVAAALARACSQAGSRDLVLVTGSLFVVAEALEA